MNKIAIIGGGASGMIAAITAAKAGAHVTIFEKKDRIGKKILATGNGKCNFSNLCLSSQDYHSKTCKDITPYLNQFGVEETVSFFQDLGMLVKDKNGYLYPASEQSSTVLDIMRIALAGLGVKIRVDISQVKISTQNNSFLVSTNLGEEKFQKVILCCGSQAGEKPSVKENPKNKNKQSVLKDPSISQYENAMIFGHKLVPIVPSLVQLRCNNDYFKGIAGVRVDAVLSLQVNQKLVEKERGEVQLTEYGVSGIPTFQLSRTAAYAIAEQKQVHIFMDFFPDFTLTELEKLAVKRFEKSENQTVEEFFTGLLTKKLCMLAIKMGGLKPTEKVKQLDKSKIIRAILNMKQVKANVVKTNPFENAQVCAGGISMAEVSDTLESKYMPNLYLAGEMLDIDGRCGGYNLQWAWTSGYIAGKAAALQ